MTAPALTGPGRLYVATNCVVVREHEVTPGLKRQGITRFWWAKTAGHDERQVRWVRLTAAGLGCTCLGTDSPTGNCDHTHAIAELLIKERREASLRP